jgi:tripartite-type tricarboxylate transporter receptor subunit TctC
MTALRFFRILCALLALAAPASIFAQAAFPDRPVKIVVGFPPGSTADLIARLIAPKMGEGLGQPVVVENRPGAGSSIAAESVARAPADGSTLLLSTIANTINPSLVKLGFDFSKDLAPIAMLAEAPALLVAHPSAPHTVKDLVAAAKARPGEILYGSSGNGTVTHLYGELFNLAAGVKLAHVPYKGSSQAVTDLLAGRIQVLFTPASTVIPHVKARTLNALGAIGGKRIPALPDVPTLAESGIAGFDAALWFGLNAPAATPAATLERLNREAVRALSVPEVRAQLAAQSIESVPGSREAFGAFILKDTEKWARVVRTAGITAE